MYFALISELLELEKMMTLVPRCSPCGCGVIIPMPTYMIGTYNEDNTVDVMMMAWGGICAEDMVALNLEAEHKTVTNLETRKAFTLPFPERIHCGNLIFLESPAPTK